MRDEDVRALKIDRGSKTFSNLCAKIVVLYPGDDVSSRTSAETFAAPCLRVKQSPYFLGEARKPGADLVCAG